MKPLWPCEPTLASVERTQADMLAQPNEWWAARIGKPAAEISAQDKIETIRKSMSGYEMWTNGTYDVHKRFIGEGPLGDLYHLSIKRCDRAPVTDWRDKQAIKNQLCGEESSGAELYPAESRVVDTANQYHLWVFANGCGFESLGFQAGIKDSVEIGYAKQREFEQ